MKTKLFIIALIGTISATTLASTPMSEQKQEATISKQWVTPVLVDVVKVQSDLVLFQNEITIVALVTENPFQTKSTKPINSFAIVDDVGWQFQKRFSQNTFYKERLKQKYLTDYSQLISKLGIKHNKESC
jgi:hypothetical protein